MLDTEIMDFDLNSMISVLTIIFRYSCDNYFVLKLKYIRYEIYSTKSGH